MKNKKAFWVITILFLSGVAGRAQVEKNVFRWSAGIGYEEGFVNLTKIPALGISYERLLNQHLSIATHLFSYYRSMPDSYFDKSPNGGYPIVTLAAPGVSGPFISEEDLQQLMHIGLKNLSPKKTIKMLSVPFDLGITVYPISSKTHKLGINLATSLTFESSNWPRDYFEGGIITLEDGTVYNNAFLSLNTEFRSWVPGASLKVLYEVHLPSYILGFRIGNYNSFFFGNANFPIWETSLYIAFKW